MNTTLTEISQEEIEELRKDYYAEYYPSPRIEKAIFNYLDQDYYASEDDVFYTIYNKENDFFVNREEIEKEITKMFGLHLPERIKVGPNEDDYIEPARNPIPGRVIHKWIVKHQLNNFGIGQEDKEIVEDLEYWGVDGDEMGPIKDQDERDAEEILMDVPERIEEQEINFDTTDDEISSLETQIAIDKKTIQDLEKDLKDTDKKDRETKAFGKTKRFGYEDDDDEEPVIGIGRDASAFKESELIEEPEGDGEDTQKTNWPEWKPDFELDDTTKKIERQIKQTNIDIKKDELARKEKQLKDLETSKKTTQQSAPAMGSQSTQAMGGGETSTTGPINIKKIVTEQVNPEDYGIIDGEKKDDGAERLYKQHAHDNEDYVDNSPFTRKETIILKALHKNLTRDELRTIAQETPSSYGFGLKFWQVMKLFGIVYTNDMAEDTRSSIYAKWAYDNWTADGDYGSIEQPIKAPLKWYEIDRSESGSQIEYRDGTTEVLGFDEDDAGDRADYDFYSWGGDMETTDYGDYETYDSQIDRAEFKRLDEQMDPELKYTIDQQYRTNPEMRDELLQSLEDEGDGKYYLNPEGTELNVPPIKIAQKFSEVNDYGNIKFDMQGGNGIAYFTDKNLVIKLTTDESEYLTANKLVGTENEYIVKVFESARIKTSHTINDDLFVIVLEALPMTE